MNAPLALRLAATAMSLMASISFAQEAMPKTAAEVTDEQIEVVQGGVESGCVKKGLSRGAPEAQLRSSCACLAGVMRAQLTKAEWQRLAIAALAQDGTTAHLILEPHKTAFMSACKPAKP